MHWFIDACEGLPLDVLVFAPSAVPASPFESPRAPLSLEDIAGILARERVIGLAEMMNYPAVIAGAPEELAKIALAAGKRIDGTRRVSSARNSTPTWPPGIGSDHEATVLGEALEKRRRGAWVLLREASNARNLRDLLPLVREYGPERCAFCTDDREPDFLLREGHIDQMCRVAVAQGISPEDALLLATLHPALCHGLPRVGRDRAGLPRRLRAARRPQLVPGGARAQGRPRGRARRRGAALRHRRRRRTGCATRCASRRSRADSFRLHRSGERVRAIGLIRDQILTEHLVLTPSAQDGEVVADPSATSPRSRSSSAITRAAASASAW